MKLTNIASLDPQITSTGRKGLQGASHADKAMWDEMQANWNEFAFEAHQSISYYTKENVSENDLAPSFSSSERIDYTGNNKIAQTKIRIGQAFFRRAVLSAYSFKCCITGLSLPELLVASHIVPWMDNVENRLNPRNGLCLSILHDKAFDIGIITINEDFTVRVSHNEILKNDIFFSSALLEYDKKPIVLPEKFQPHANFLEYHRKKIYKGY